MSEKKTKLKLFRLQYYMYGGYYNMDKSVYFYQYLELISKELVLVGGNLKIAFSQVHRTMLTHARIFKYGSI